MIVLLLCFQAGWVGFGVLCVIEGMIALGLFNIALNVGFFCLNIHTLSKL